MKPIDIIVSMLAHSFTIQAESAALAVVFAMIRKGINELPGDNAKIAQWLDDAITRLVQPKKI